MPQGRRPGGVLAKWAGFECDRGGGRNRRRERNGASSWRTPPEPVEEFVEEHDYDVVVVGHGYAGVCACRELAESGVRVALLERQPEDTYMATGSESMAINSRSSIVPPRQSYSPCGYERVLRELDDHHGNQVNPASHALSKQADNIDWYYDGLTDEDFAHVTHTGWPDAGDEWEHLLPNIGPIRFYPERSPASPRNATKRRSKATIARRPRRPEPISISGCAASSWC